MRIQDVKAELDVYVKSVISCNFCCACACGARCWRAMIPTIFAALQISKGGWDISNLGTRVCQRPLHQYKHVFAHIAIVPKDVLREGFKRDPLRAKERPLDMDTRLQVANAIQLVLPLVNMVQL